MRPNTRYKAISLTEEKVIKTFDKKVFILIIITLILTNQHMAFGDLVVEVIVREKGKIINKQKSESNNDILDMKHSWMVYLEKRIADLGYKVAKEVNSIRMQ